MSYILILWTTCFTNRSSRKELYLSHLENGFPCIPPSALLVQAVSVLTCHLTVPHSLSVSWAWLLLWLSGLLSFLSLSPFHLPLSAFFLLYLLCLYFFVQLIPKGFLCTLQYLWVLLKCSELNKFWNLLISYHLFSFTVSSQ